MTDLEKAARMALDAICGSGDFLFNWHDCEPNNEREMQAYQAALAANEKAINALRQALGHPAKQRHIAYVCPQCYWTLEEQPAQQSAERGEPVAWRNAALRVGEDLCSVGPFGYYDMTAEQWLDWALSVVTVHSPPANANAGKPWVGLTNEEWRDIVDDTKLDNIGAIKTAIEAKLKEKNNG